MGAFYANVTVVCDDQQAVADVLKRHGRIAYVCPAVNGSATVLDRGCDSQDGRELTIVAKSLSSELHTAAIAILNHDDDILWYELYEGGEKKDEHDSCPYYFDGATASPRGPVGGNAETLCRIFNQSEDDAEKVEDVLRSDEYVFEMERHEALWDMLALSSHAIGFAYASVERNELPEGLELEEFIHVC